MIKRVEYELEELFIFARHAQSVCNDTPGRPLVQQVISCSLNLSFTPQQAKVQVLLHLDQLLLGCRQSLDACFALVVKLRHRVNQDSLPVLSVVPRQRHLEGALSVTKQRLQLLLKVHDRAADFTWLGQ